MAIALELVQGTARDFPFQVTNPDGSIPVNVFSTRRFAIRLDLGRIE